MSAPRFPIAVVLAWAGVASLAIGAWLAVPAAWSETTFKCRVVLVDDSTSAVATRPSTWRSSARSILERSFAEAKAAGQDVEVTVNGWSFEDLDDLAPSRLRGVDDSDLAADLRSLARVYDSARPRISWQRKEQLERIDVIGDGTWTGTDPSGPASVLAARGTEIVRIDLSPPEIDNVGIAPLPSPLRVRSGEPLAIEVETWWWPSVSSTPVPAVQITADLSHDGRSRRTVKLVELPPQSGGIGTGPIATRALLDLPALESASARLELRVNPLDSRGVVYADPIHEDDKISLEILAEGTLSVGLAGEPAARAELRRALGSLPADVALFDLESVRALEGIEVLVTTDEIFEVGEDQILSGFVSAGGGWLDLAGPGFTGGLRPGFAALQPAPEDSTSREVVVLVDASGSMAGEPWITAQSALARLVELAPVTDGLSALWFSAESSSPVDLGRPGDRADPARRRAILARIASAPEARGPTRLWAALEALADAESDRSRSVVAIVVTDGRDPERADFAARAASLRARLAGVRVDLAVVAAGPDPDRELLGALAGDPVRLLDAGDLAASDAAARLASQLQRAASRGVVVEDETARAISTGSSATLRDLTPPALHRFVRARERDGAQVAWTAASTRAETPTSPLLAFARHGLGQVAGLAFLPDSTWVREPHELSAALATALRAIAPPADRARPRLVERDGDLVLEDVGEGVPAIARATLVSEHGQALGTVELLAARAGHDPLHARSAPLPPALADLAAGERVLVTIDMGPGSPPLSTSFVAPRASEFARLPGVFEPPQRVAEAAKASAEVPHPGAPVFLLLGLLGIASAAFLGLFSRFAR